MVQPVRAESDWQEEWGGALRIFTERRMDCERYSGTVLPESTRSTSTSEAHVDVLPEAGTLVLMRSAQIEHEVLETQRPRRCVVGWLCSREAG
jgi:SM-20-related protein